MTHTFTLTVTPLNLAIGWLVLVVMAIAYWCWKFKDFREVVFGVTVIALIISAAIATISSIFYVVNAFFPNFP